MPQAFAGFLVSAYGWTATAATIFSYAVFIGATVAYGGYQRRKQEQRARNAANASAKDREIMVRSAIAPRRIIYGRDKVSGPVVFMESTGDKKEFLHIVIALAAHECDEIEKVYFNEIELPELDSEGFVTSGEFKSPETTGYETHTGTTNGGGVITIPHNALTIESAFQETGIGEAANQIHYPDRTHTPGTDTVGNLPADTSVTITYTYTIPGVPRVRVRKLLGGAGQIADPDLVAESAGLWTEDHVGADICSLYVRLEYDRDIFGSIGVPNISALVRGKLVFDPRTTETAWTECAALCTADYLKSAEGMRATDAEVPDAEIEEAANICEEEVDLHEDGTVAVTNGSATVTGSGTEWTTYAFPGLTFVGPDDVRYMVLSVTDDTHLELAAVYGGSSLSGQSYLFKQLRYTCNTSFTTDRAPRDVLGDLADCMAGRAVWTQGRWLLRAGAYRTPTLTITADMLAGPISVVPKASRSELFNAIRATHRDDTKAYAEVQAPLVKNSGYEDDDGGVRIVRQIDVPTIADTYRAQRLSKIELERARQAVTVRLTTNLKAYDLSPSDTVMLTLSHYGWTAKVFDVLERTLTAGGLIQYTLRETAAGVWAWNFGDETIGDLAPDTDLPNPYGVPAMLTGLEITQDSAILNDGTIVLAALLSWDPSEDAFVISGGRIEVEWARADDLVITSVRRAGTDVDAELSPLIGGFAYITRARQINAVGKASDWAYLSFVADFDTEPPENVTGLDWAIKPGLVRITCDPCIARDYAETELRYMDTEPDYDSGDWDAATFLVSGKSNEYHHPRPPNGTYYVLAKHKDTSGNYSEDPAYITVVVDDSIDQLGGGTLRLTTDRFPFFAFADGTTHTSSSDPLVITARLYGLTGSPVFTAEAFDAADDSLGEFSLDGDGLTRTLTAAQFVAEGSSGSVRYLQVTATLAGAVDTLTVFRQDPTITEPRLYLDNPRHEVSTDADGNFGDYTDALTNAVVYVGIDDVTDDFDFSITADAGLTATINGGAGPITGEAVIVVAVSASTISDGVVEIQADDGVDTLSGLFRVVKRRASGSAYTAFFDPDEIVLPVNSDGSVSSYAGANSDFTVLLGTLPDTESWQPFDKEDLGVVSTLSGNRVTITEWIGLGTLGSLQSNEVTPATGWQRGNSATWCDDVWVMFGHHDSADFSTVLRSADFEAWDEVDTGANGRWGRAAYGAQTLVAIELGVSSNAIIRSADRGLTWTADTLSQTAEWSHIQFGDGFLTAAADGTEGSYSADGDTWANRTLPADDCALSFAAPWWGAVSPAGDLYTSDDTGSTWSAALNSGMSLPAGNEAHRCVGFRGALVCALRDETDQVKITIDGGATWITVITPVEYSAPIEMLIVQQVLYLVSADLTVLYTADGLVWHEASAPYGAGAAIEHAIYGMGDSIEVGYLPSLSAGTSDGVPLAANILLIQGGADASLIVQDLSSFGDSVTITDYAEFDDAHPVFGANNIKQSTAAAAIPSFSSTGSTSRFGRATGDKITIQCWVYIDTLENFSPSSFFFSWFVDSSRILEVGTNANTANAKLRLRNGDDVALETASISAGAHFLQMNIDNGAYTLDMDGTEVYAGTNTYGIGIGVTYQFFVAAQGSSGSASGPSTAIWATPLRMTKGVLRPRGSVPAAAFDVDAAQYAHKQPLLSGSDTVGFVRLTGHKDGELPITRSLTVRKAGPSTEIFTSSASPPYLLLPATADGVVTDYTNASITAKVTGRSARDATAEYSWVWTATNLTPSSGTGATATFTAMDPDEDRGQVTFVGESPGREQISGTLNVDKLKGITLSGPVPGAVFNAFSFVATYVALRFAPNGHYLLKVGSGGSFVVIGQWAGALGAQNEDFWLRVETSGHALDSGTEDTWVQMNATRDYVLSDAASGTHRTDLLVWFATDNTGAGAVPAYGALELRVP